MHHRSMRRTAPLLTALAIAIGSPVAIAKKDLAPPTPLVEVMTMRVEGAIEVDATGRVLSHAIDTKLPDAVRAKLDRAIPAWTFKPIEMPAGTSAKVPMVLTIAATQVAEGHIVRLEAAEFADGPNGTRPTRVATRTYLKSPYRATDAIVRIAARVDADGHALDAASLGCTLYNAGGDAEEKALMCRRLEALSLEGVLQARFREFNMALPGMGEVWFYFNPQGPMDERPGRWRVESSTGTRKVAWYPASESPSTFALREGIVGASL
ncbi:MAG: hypothetical protein HOQ01_08075 [Lysobacter sp.]|nr:hypothetical protein [Lysobacter sp.]